MPNYTKLLQKVMPQVTRFPSGQPFMKMGLREPVIGRFDENDLGHEHIAWLRSEGWEPLQGPDLPLEPYLAWKAMKREDNPIYRRWAYDDYRRALEADRARQRYNQKVSAWNEYTDMSPAERRYWANRDRLPNTTPRALEEYLMSNPGPYPEIESFDEFSSLYGDLADAPWRY